MTRTKLSTILFTTFIAGTLDILCAIFILAKGNTEGTFRFIARGAFGDAAYSGGTEVIIYGIIFHYFIALSYSTVFFFIYPHISLLRKNRIISGLIYGVVVWSCMQFIVLPLTHNAPGPINWSSAWKGIVILMIAFGLPISLITSSYYHTKISNK